ncbi:carboxypeptidase-like regulatory domain-containing protein [Mucilaginibacter sp. KACC 22063]|uniref:carboxypeptidase-like regulatory domain-containing protein n=1 Tax=Mucilaginibacter sp. KACC 22063 TaxID=3025666 RepID=UPI00236528C3|nr:carboxypeptidase-like regulatory domain-containing protein [Mucilaginibacter sp. KACC 22063]WDF56363.1 carboxypeptidase-like regulatory domain-containing protein [Mucilaginibacter sp. KACC 22063]
MLRFVFLLILTPLFGFAQYAVKGKIINESDGKPIAKASIYLSNTTIGTTTADDGTFSLNNVKQGQYDFIASVVGFESAQLNITVNTNLNLETIKLKPTTTQLNEVVIRPDKEWEQNYAMFKTQLFGMTDFAAKCKILNPEILDLENDKQKHLLTGKSNGYLDIVNDALGYKLHYNLVSFEFDYRHNSFYYQWSVLYEELKGSRSQQKRWSKNREKAYYGSAEHYFKSALNSQTEREGFKTLTLLKKPNMLRPPDSLIRAKVRMFDALVKAHSSRQNSDSLNYWLNKSSLPKINQYLISKPVHIDSMIHRTDVKGIYALAFKDYMYIIFNESIKKADAYNYEVSPNTSVAQITDPYLFFDTNGVIANLHGVIYEGDWARRRVATLLPVDYEPERK